jgi:hypothetical protein
MESAQISAAASIAGNWVSRSCWSSKTHLS